jgi:hypothetical protein
VIAAVLATIGVTLGISVDDLAYTDHKSAAFGASSTADPSANAGGRTE